MVIIHLAFSLSVELCLEGLKQLLPARSAMSVLSTYYLSSHGLPYSRLLGHFQTWLLTCLNLPARKTGSSGVETSHVASESSSEQYTVDSKLLNSIPALKLFTSINKPLEMVGVASHKTPPITDAAHVTSLEAHRESVVYALHLMYEVIM